MILSQCSYLFTEILSSIWFALFCQCYYLINLALQRSKCDLWPVTLGSLKQTRTHSGPAHTCNTSAFCCPWCLFADAEPLSWSNIPFGPQLSAFSQTTHAQPPLFKLSLLWLMGYFLFEEWTPWKESWQRWSAGIIVLLLLLKRPIHQAAVWIWNVWMRRGENKSLCMSTTRSATRKYFFYWYF